ncbi:MAG: precorrin-6y C5,15-methyltransferase (decarboxylating) subunit CbiE [Hyphomicrobiales bacterium]|nr:precorrin-6y C5,15-methyltransferase (decarboxylating) subunit CbiE [Hyphomicrobiales bacterium]
MSPWLSIVGLGEDGLHGLDVDARALIERAEVLVGGKRHLAMVPEDGRERLTWTTPIGSLIEVIVARRGARVCILATGDPMAYGIGVTLARRVAKEEMIVVPRPSAFSLAAARLTWALSEVDCLTLHGRPLELIHPNVQPDAKLLLLSEDRRTPAKVAELLTERDYGGSVMTVLEHMGGGRERIIEGTAAAWSCDDLADLNTIAVTCVASPDAALLSRSPGLPDSAFHSDGLLTKQEVRAATLAALVPIPGQLLWDVGAGCGSIAIEWMRAAARTRAIAIERRPDRLALIADNAAALGAPTLEVVEGDAPQALRGLLPPDAVFIGGGATADGVFEACWKALRPGGRLVANVVTLEGEQAVLSWRQKVGGALTRIAASRAAPVGPFTGWRPLMPVTTFSVSKT